MSKLRAFTMPKWGIEMLEGTISEWNVKEGEAVAKGQVIAQIETDKIVNEVQIEYDTHMARLIAVPGEAYAVGALLAVTADQPAGADEVEAFVRAFGRVGGDGSGVAPSSSISAAPGAVAPGAVRPGSAAPEAAPPTIVHIPPDVRLSPAARQLALRAGVDVAGIEGHGRGGRITYQDVDQAAKPKHAVGGSAPVSIAPTASTSAGAYASPYAERLAVRHAIDLRGLAGSGPRGRIGLRDVAKAAGLDVPPPRGAAGVEILRMSPTRRAIARQLTVAKSTIPHFYLRMQVNLDALLALRAEEKSAHGVAPSINDYMIRAAALALVAAPDVNIQVHGAEIHRFKNADISIAVAADKGLITPVIRAAQGKSVNAIAAELRALIGRARGGKLRAEEIEGGSFTVSNLGMFGVDQFDAIINPPQGAILAVGAARARPIERGGGLSVGQVANFSLSCDHRAIDGAVGATFLKALADLLENPRRL